MTITIKTGVPGSGKTQSMVADLSQHLAAMKKTGLSRPIYTNITGLDQAVIPHFPMADMPPASEVFVRQPGVIYTIDWQQCPPGSLVVIDEAQKNGFEATSSQKPVASHVAQLAVHRKDFSLDIWLITQHPKLLHSAARRQCGKHQHYERKFGFKSAFCFEWHECQDNLLGKKTAVLSRFAFSSKYENAYHSAEVHTKTKFKIPLWVALPALALPLAVFALPRAYGALSSSMTGKGISQGAPVAKNETTSQIVENGVVITKTVSVVPTPPQPAVAAAATATPASAPFAPSNQVMSGCIMFKARCGCFDAAGRRFEAKPETCTDTVSSGATPVTFSVPAAPVEVSEAEKDALSFAFADRRASTTRGRD